MEINKSGTVVWKPLATVPYSFINIPCGYHHNVRMFHKIRWDLPCHCGLVTQECASSFCSTWLAIKVQAHTKDYLRDPCGKPCTLSTDWTIHLSRSAAKHVSVTLKQFFTFSMMFILCRNLIIWDRKLKLTSDVVAVTEK